MSWKQKTPDDNEFGKRESPKRVEMPKRGLPLLERLKRLLGHGTPQRKPPKRPNKPQR